VALSFKDVNEILRIVDDAKFAEIKLEFDGLSVHVVPRGSGGPHQQRAPTPTAQISTPALERNPATPTPATPPKTQALPSTAQEPPPGMLAIHAPMAGTFYRAPSPGAKPFVEVGSIVTSADTVGIIEVMKLFTSLSSGVAGRVAAILVADGMPVSAQQVLMHIEQPR
jgi:acetyl-CoA carboxylase biotin carboxyl carrier protein